MRSRARRNTSLSSVRHGSLARIQSTAALWKRRKATWSWAMTRFSSLRWSPISARDDGLRGQIALEVAGRRDLHTRHVEDLAEAQLDAVVGDELVVVLGRDGERTVAVDRVEVQRRVAQVAEVSGDLVGIGRCHRRRLDGADRRLAVGVGRQVVIDELTEVGVDRRDRRVRRRPVPARRRILDHRGTEGAQSPVGGGRDDQVGRRIARQVGEEVVEVGAVVRALLVLAVAEVGDHAWRVGVVDHGRVLHLWCRVGKVGSDLRRRGPAAGRR